MNKTAYRGEHPHRIQSVSMNHEARLLTIKANDGEALYLKAQEAAKALNHKLPMPGEDIGHLRSLPKAYVVTVLDKVGDTFTHVCDTARQALELAHEEAQWESCERVTCPQLGLDLDGTFNV